MELIKKRILFLLAKKGLSVNSASKILNIPQRTLNRQLNETGNVSMDLIRAIHKCFPEVSLNWVLSGKNDMCIEKNNDKCGIKLSPYYELPVCAGIRDVIDEDNEIANTFVSIPGVKADFFFPVTGSSMQPEVNPGDIIGVNRINPFTELDENKIYMIITREERMIKYCSYHKDDENLILCLSPNYPTFTLRKDEIIAMYSVVVRVSYL